MKRKYEVMVGLVITAAVAVLVLGTLWLQGARFMTSTTVVRAAFSEVGQLRPGNEVKYRGVSVGRVEGFDVAPGGQSVIVTFRVDSDLEYPEDPVVILSPESLFGDWQAEFASRFRYPQLEFLDSTDPEILSGYAIPDISRLTLQAERIANNLGVITDRIEIAFTEETAENIREAIDNIQDVSRTLNDLVTQQGEAIQEVTAEVQAAAEEVGAAAEAARFTFEQVGGTLEDGDLAGLMDDARVATANLRDVSATLAEASGDMASTMAQADTAFQRVNRIAARVEAGEGTLGMLLADSSLALEARDVLQRLDELLVDFRANPKRYVRLSIF